MDKNDECSLYLIIFFLCKKPQDSKISLKNRFCILIKKETLVLISVLMKKIEAKKSITRIQALFWKSTRNMCHKWETGLHNLFPSFMELALSWYHSMENDNFIIKLVLMWILPISYYCCMGNVLFTIILVLKRWKCYFFNHPGINVKFTINVLLLYGKCSF